MMNFLSRRRVLQTVTGCIASSLGGCTTPSERGSPTAQATPTPKITTGDTFPRLSVSSNTPPSDSEMRTEVSRIHRFTAESPARIRAKLTNTARAERVFRFGSVVPFTPFNIQHETKQVQLQLIPVPEEASGAIDSNDDGEFDVVPDATNKRCWNAEDEVVFSSERRFVTLDKKESVEKVFTVVGHPTDDECLPKGKYQTANSISISNKKEDATPGQKFSWEIRLTLF